MDPNPDATWLTMVLAKLILIPILGYQYRDTTKMKEIVTRFDSIDWTLVGLPRLTDGKVVGHFEAG